MRLTAFLALLLTLTVSHAQTLIVGTPEYNPPFVIASDKHHYIGFDVDILSEICRRIAVKCEFKPLSFGDVFTLLEQHKIDLAMGGITITLDRDRKFDFSLPYLPSYGQYVVKYNSKLHSIDDIDGMTIGVANASVYKNILNNRLGHSISIKTYDYHFDLFSALTVGDVDVILTDRATAESWDYNTTNTYRFLGKPIQVGFGYGIVANKGNSALLSRINKAMLAMEMDGTYVKIYNNYFSLRKL